jgi:hypothetical protein
MPSQEDIEAQQELLEAYRRTLSHYLNQRAQLGTGHVPPSIYNGILEAQENIQRIKSFLRSSGEYIQDLPYDQKNVSDKDSGVESINNIKIATIGRKGAGKTTFLLCSYNNLQEGYDGFSVISPAKSQHLLLNGMRDKLFGSDASLRWPPPSNIIPFYYNFSLNFHQKKYSE